MQELGKIHQLIIPFFGHDLTFNLEVILMTWIVIFILIAFGILINLKKNILPGPFQVVGELLIKTFSDLAEESLGEELAKRYSPMICALFMFLLISNWLGILPHLEEPTKDLNTTLGLGLMGTFFIAHFEGIRVKGLKNYLKEYTEPFIPMIPLNIIGEMANVVSISFRLFGNIMGGSIIILVVSFLVYSIALPPFLNIFFGLFVGTIQAFVFTMLTTVYISLKVK